MLESTYPLLRPTKNATGCARQSGALELGRLREAYAVLEALLWLRLRQAYRFFWRLSRGIAIWKVIGHSLVYTNCVCVCTLHRYNVLASFWQPPVTFRTQVLRASTVTSPFEMLALLAVARRQRLVR